MTNAPGTSTSSGGGTGDSDGEDESWRRDFTLLLGGSALSQLGTLGAAAANPLLALVLTDSPIIAGWVAAASTLPGLLLHLPAGLLVDHYDRKRIMLVSQLIRVVNSALLFVGLGTVAEPWPILLVAAAIDGSCAVFFRIAEFAAVRFVVPDGEAENAMGKSEARHHVALVLGRPLGGLLFAVGHALPYALDAVTSFVSVLSILLLKRKRFQSFESRKMRFWRIPRGKVLPFFKEGTGQIREDGFLRVSLLSCALANVGFQVVILLLVVEAQRRNFSGTAIGAMLAISGVSGFVGAITAARVVRRLKPHRTVRICVALWLPCLLVVALSMGRPLVGMCAWGMCSLMGAYINVALAVHQSKVVPREILGRVEGVTQFLTTGAVALGASVGGYVIEAFGTRSTAWLVAVVFAVITIGVWSPVSVPAVPQARPVLKTGGKMRAPETGDSASTRGTVVRMSEEG